MRLSRPTRLLVGAHLEPVLDEMDARVDHRLLDRRYLLEEPLRLLLGAESHDPLDAGAVVPAPVEDHDFAAGGEVRDVPLHVHLRLLALGGCGKRDHVEHTRADAFGDRLDGATLPRGVPAFEHDADLRPARLHPFLHGDELTVQPTQLAQVLLLLHPRGRRGSLGSATVLVILLVVIAVVLGHVDRLLTRSAVSIDARAGATARSTSSIVGAGARRRRIHLPASITTGSASARPIAASHCGPVSEVVSSPRCRLGSCVARKIIAVGTTATPSGDEDRRCEPARRIAAVGQRVEHRAQAHHHERHGQRRGGMTGAGLVGSGDQGHERGGRQDGAVDDPEDHRGAVGDRQLRIPGWPVHDVGVAGIERDDHDACRGDEHEQVDDHQRRERDTLVDVEHRRGDEQHDEGQQLRHLVADVGDDLLVDAAADLAPR